MNEHDTLVFYGGEVKALDDNGRVGGYLVRFGGRDLDGEYFTPDCYLGKSDGNGRDLMFHHGIPIKTRDGQVLTDLAEHEFTHPITTRRDEVGVWAEAVLDMANEYEAQVYDLAKRGKLGWSSGALNYTVRKTPDGGIKKWVIAEGSLTPTPAEPRNRAVSIKSLSDGNAPEGAPEDAQASAAPDNAEDKPIIKVELKEETMTEEVKATAQPNGQDTRLDAMAEQMKSIMALLENEPKLRQSRYVSDDGGKADPQVKSLGDFLLAVKRGDASRLTNVYGAVKSTKTDQSDTDGTLGGYLIPHTFHAELLQIIYEQSPLMGLVRRQTVPSRSGEYPALDQFIAPTTPGSGQTAFAGGATSARRASGGAYTETNANFAMVNYNVHSQGGYFTAPKELSADSAIAIEGLLRNIIGVTVAAKMERDILRGSGQSEPLGILSATGTNYPTIEVTVDTADAFTWEDSVEMRSRLKVINPAAVRWVTHLSSMPQFGTFQVGTTGNGILNQVLNGQIVQTLHGYPILYSEHMPRTGEDKSILLADFSAYILFERQQLEIAYSEHADFLNGNDVWRFDYRADGKPWVKNKITLNDPQAASPYTISPYVTTSES